MKSSALVLAPGAFATDRAKTAHGLVRGSDRFDVVGVVDAGSAGRDAGEVLDGRRREIPVFASLERRARARAAQARHLHRGRGDGGRLHAPRGPGACWSRRREAGLTLVNGLHELAADDPRHRRRGRAQRARIVDLRRPRPVQRAALLDRRHRRGAGAPAGGAGHRLRAGQAHHRAHAGRGLPAGRAAGRDDLHRSDRVDAGGALRLRARLDPQRLRRRRAGGGGGRLRRRGSAPTSSSSRGSRRCATPRGPAGPSCWSRPGRARCILQHAPGRPCFKGHAGLGSSLACSRRSSSIRLYGAQVLAVTLNGDRLSRRRCSQRSARLAAQLALPVVAPARRKGVARARSHRRTIRATSSGSRCRVGAAPTRSCRCSDHVPRR